MLFRLHERNERLWSFQPKRNEIDNCDPNIGNMWENINLIHFFYFPAPMWPQFMIQFVQYSHRDDKSRSEVSYLRSLRILRYM